MSFRGRLRLDRFSLARKDKQLSERDPFTPTYDLLGNGQYLSMIRTMQSSGVKTNPRAISLAPLKLQSQKELSSTMLYSRLGLLPGIDGHSRIDIPKQRSLSLSPRYGQGSVRRIVAPSSPQIQFGINCEKSVH